MLSVGGSLDIEAFDTRLRQAVMQARAQHRDASTGDLEIRMHPYDVEDLELAALAQLDARRSPTAGPEQPGEPRLLRWRDIPVLKDINIGQGSPELRSAWKVVL